MCTNSVSRVIRDGRGGWGGERYLADTDESSPFPLYVMGSLGFKAFGLVGHNEDHACAVGVVVKDVGLHREGPLHM